MENQWEWDPTAVSNYQIHVTQSPIRTFKKGCHLVTLQ